MKKMKVVLVSICVLIGLTLNAQTSNVVIDSSQVVESVSDNFEQVLYEDGKSFLKNLTVGSGEIAKDGYQIMVNQQLVYAIQYLLVCILGFLLLYLAYRIYSKGNANNKWNILTPTIILFLAALPLLYMGGTHLDIIVQGFVNPDYAAIKDIIDMAKTLKLK